MKKLLAVFAPTLKSKKFQEFIVGIVASVIVHFLKLEPAVALKLSTGIITATTGLILAQGAADMGSGGKTSANGPDANPSG